MSDVPLICLPASSQRPNTPAGMNSLYVDTNGRFILVDPDGAQREVTHEEAEQLVGARILVRR